MSVFQSPLSSYMDDYLAYRKALGYSEKTYMPFLCNLDRFLCAMPLAEAILSRDAVMRWLERHPNESRYSQNNRAGQIRGFAQYLSALGVPTFVLPNRFLSSKRNFQPYIFTDDELAALFTTVDDNCLENGLEAIAFSTMIRLIYTCGLRPGEGRLLCAKDVDLETGIIHIADGKRHIERFVTMSEDMTSAMIAYARQRNSIFPYADAFFVTGNGGFFSGEKVRRTFQESWQRCNSGIPRENLPCVRIYDLRHRFACAALNRWLDEGQDLYVMLPYLSAYMGHSTLSSTAYYIHLLPENLIKSAGVDWNSMNALIPEVDIW